MVRFDTPEGATPIEDASGLLVEGVLTYAALNAVETENIVRAVTGHLRRGKRRGAAWLMEDYVRRVHRDMFDSVWEWAGLYAQVGRIRRPDAHRPRRHRAARGVR